MGTLDHCENCRYTILNLFSFNYSHCLTFGKGFLITSNSLLLSPFWFWPTVSVWTCRFYRVGNYSWHCLVCPWSPHADSVGATIHIEQWVMSGLTDLFIIWLLDLMIWLKHMLNFMIRFTDMLMIRLTDLLMIRLTDLFMIRLTDLFMIWLTDLFMI